MVIFENEPNTSVVVEQVINALPKSYKTFKLTTSFENLIKKL
jgi:hypothetical protein